LEEVSEGADGFVSFLAAGEPANGQFSCSECGYGICVRRALPTCPMCGGVCWERERLAFSAGAAVTAREEQPVA
jgi:rubrerythrin